MTSLINLSKKFAEYAKIDRPQSDMICLLCLREWMQNAGVIDGKEITGEDLLNAYRQIKQDRQKMFLRDVRKITQILATEKHKCSFDVMNKMIEAPSPTPNTYCETLSYKFSELFHLYAGSDEIMVLQLIHWMIDANVPEKLALSTRDLDEITERFGNKIFCVETLFQFLQEIAAQYGVTAYFLAALLQKCSTVKQCFKLRYVPTAFKERFLEYARIDGDADADTINLIRINRWFRQTGAILGEKCSMKMVRKTMKNMEKDALCYEDFIRLLEMVAQGTRFDVFDFMLMLLQENPKNQFKITDIPTELVNLHTEYANYCTRFSSIPQIRPSQILLWMMKANVLGTGIHNYAKLNYMFTNVSAERLTLEDFLKFLQLFSVNFNIDIFLIMEKLINAGSPCLEIPEILIRKLVGAIKRYAHKEMNQSVVIISKWWNQAQLISDENSLKDIETVFNSFEKFKLDVLEFIIFLEEVAKMRGENPIDLVNALIGESEPRVDLKIRLVPLVLREEFERYATLGNTKYKPSTISLAQIDRWMDSTGLFTYCGLSPRETGISFCKFRKNRLHYEQFLLFVEDLANMQKIDVPLILEGLIAKPEAPLLRCGGRTSSKRKEEFDAYGFITDEDPEANDTDPWDLNEYDPKDYANEDLLFKETILGEREDGFAPQEQEKTTNASFKETQPKLARKYLVKACKSSPHSITKCKISSLKFKHSFLTTHSTDSSSSKSEGTKVLTSVYRRDSSVI